MDINKYDKEFSEKREGGFKWWFMYVLSWIFGVIGWFFAVLGIIWENTNYWQGGYISLLTVMAGLFGIQFVFKCKTYNWNLKLILPLIFNALALALACFILYIYMPMLR